MTLALIVDIAAICLLIATIGYAVTLNKKLNYLREARNEFSDLLARFGDAVTQAESGLEQIKGSAQVLDDTLKESMTAAEQMRGKLATDINEMRSLADDLTFLTKRAGSLADRLEAQSRTSSPSMTSLAADRPSLANLRAAEEPPPNNSDNREERHAQDPISADDGGNDKLDRSLLAALQNLR